MCPAPCCRVGTHRASPPLQVAVPPSLPWRDEYEWRGYLPGACQQRGPEEEAGLVVRLGGSSNPVEVAAPASQSGRED